MLLNEYQRRASMTAKYPSNMAILYTCLGLAGEAGEVSNKVKKLIIKRESLSPEISQSIALELGDVLWYLSQLSHDIGYTLKDIAQMNLDKLSFREQSGTIVER